LINSRPLFLVCGLNLLWGKKKEKSWNSTHLINYVFSTSPKHRDHPDTFLGGYAWFRMTRACCY
jgi:hypothetical protein